MNFKKSIYSIGILTLLFTFNSCDNNDDEQTNPSSPTDGFTHNGVFTPTANAYFEVDEDDNDNNNNNNNNGLPDNYGFFFLDGRMADGDVSTGAPVDADEYIYTLNTKNIVSFKIDVSSNPSLSNSAPTAGNTYYATSDYEDSVFEPNAIIIKNYTESMQSFNPPYLINGIEYGNPSGDDYTNAQGTNSATPTLTINAINIDTTNPALSTIDVDYFYENDQGEAFTGHYEGTLGLIFD